MPLTNTSSIPTPSHTTSSLDSPSAPPILQSNLLSLQLRAFLEASEDVEADNETLHDLFESLSQTLTDTGDSHIDIDWEERDSHLELDISALYDTTTHGVQSNEYEAWSSGECNRMMHFLKERGQGAFVEKYVVTKNIPIPRLLTAFGIYLCPELRDKRPHTLLYFLRVAMSKELSLRDKNLDINTIDDAVALIKGSKRIIILTGAGISVSCGIPDFRSQDGLYASLKDGRAGNYDLDDPQQMFDISYFRENPAVFYSFANQIYPSNFIPSPCHRFIKLIEDKGQLLRNYTQNIDTLETQAGVRNVLQCHGSFATASCVECRVRVPGKQIEEAIMARRVPLCKVCNVPTVTADSEKKRKRSKKRQLGKWDSEDEDLSEDGGVVLKGVMKPDITFFGEKLKDDFDKSLEADREHVDLLLVIGTSLKVSPVSEILTHLPHSVPQILINKTPVSHINPDIILLGDADVIVQDLCERMEWNLPPSDPPPSKKPTSSRPQRKPKQSSSASSSSSSSPTPRNEPKRVGDSHIWLFSGAEGGKWLQEVERQLGLMDADDGEELTHPVSAHSAVLPDLAQKHEGSSDDPTGKPAPAGPEVRPAKRVKVGA